MTVILSFQINTYLLTYLAMIISKLCIKYALWMCTKCRSTDLSHWFFRPVDQAPLFHDQRMGKFFYNDREKPTEPEMMKKYSQREKNIYLSVESVQTSVSIRI